MDILEVIKNLEDRLFREYGNPLEKYVVTQSDIHMTYYVGRLMEELGHKHVMPSRIKGEHEDRAYFSEKALHDAFLAGRLIERKDRKEIRNTLIEEIKAELVNYVQEYDY
jgi:hypothetical protein